MNPRFRTLIILAAAFWTGACGPSSCGDPPAQSSSAGTSSSSGASQPSPSPEGTSVMPIRRDSLPENEPKTQEGSPSSSKTDPTVSSKTASAGITLPLQELTPKTFKKALKQRRLLVMVTGPVCPDCPAAQNALESLAPEFKGQVAFARINGKEKGASAILPALMDQPMPAFVLYSGGRVNSFRQGLPVPENALKDWFRGALSRMDMAK